jgi:hypothetical protein
LLVYAALLVVGVAAAFAARIHPQEDVDALVETVRGEAGAHLSYSRQRAALNFFPQNGYTLTLYVSHASAFAPAVYLTLTRLRDERAGQTMFAAGVEGTQSFEGAELARYLERVGLSLEGLDEVYEAYFAKGPTATPRAR